MQNQTGCKIYAPGIDCAFTNHPILEPSFLYGGFPSKDLRHKFLMAQESKADPLSTADLPEGMSIINLPGHFFDMVGYRNNDDVIYLADCLSSKETLDKYQIGFIYDVSSYLETLEMVKKLKAVMFIPSHAEPTNDITSLATLNIDKVHEIADKILAVCKESILFEKVLQKLFNDYALTMNFEQYVLVGSTIRSYLSWLKDMGQINVIFEDGQLLWQTTF